MNRRDAVQYISLIVGGTIVGGNFFLQGCKSKTGVSMTFSNDDVSLLNEIADTILPTTSTPGAKAAKVGQFMTVMVNDCYEAPDQKLFHQGLAKIDDASNKKNGKSFMDSSPQQRHDLLLDLESQTKDFHKKEADYYNSLTDQQKTDLVLKRDYTGEDPLADRKRQNPVYYYDLMKQLTLLGYFTSEIGCTQAMIYVETPGRYDGCIPYKKGDKAYAL